MRCIYPLVLCLFALLLLTGGILGFALSHSIVSLATALLFAVAIVCSGIAVWKQKKGAWGVSLLLVALMLLFFLWRFWFTGKWVPSGLMVAIGGVVFLIGLLHSYVKNRK